MSPKIGAIVSNVAEQFTSLVQHHMRTVSRIITVSDQEALEVVHKYLKLLHIGCFDG